MTQTQNGNGKEDYLSRTYLFDPETWGLTAWEWDNAEFCELRSDIAWRIELLIPDSLFGADQSDGHVTADFLWWIADNLGNVRWSFDMRMKNMKSDEYTQYWSLQEALENHEFPFIVRIMSDQWWEQSVVAVCQLEDGTAVWFEQTGEWGSWWFCEIEKTIRANKGEHIFCKDV